MKVKILLLFILLYPFYLYFNTYKQTEVIWSKKVYIDGNSMLVKKINGKLLIKKQLLDNEYGIKGAGTYTLYFKNGELIGKKASYFNIFRQSLDKRMKKIFKKELYLFSKAILLNEKNMLAKEVKQKFRLLGLSHLLAISGLHFSLIYGLIQRILYYLNFRVREAFVLIFLTIYALIVGFVPSIARAYQMIFLLIVAKLCFESISTKKAYFISLVVSLLYNPYQIMEISFILSYVATFCVIFITTDNILYKNIFMQIILTPFTWLYFKKVYIFSFLINIVAIPLFTILMYLIVFNLLIPNYISLKILEEYFSSLEKILKLV